MADSTTNLPTLAVNQASKEIVQNAFNDAASPGTYWGRDYRTSGGLVWGYLGGVSTTGGSPSGPMRRPNGTLLLTANALNYVQLDVEGVVSSNLLGFDVGHAPLYRILTGATTVTSYEDLRAGPGGDALIPPPAPLYGTLLLQATWVIPTGPLTWPVNDVHVRCPVAGVITAVSLGTIGGAGSCIVDIWKDTHANYPPLSGDSICAAAKPTISGGIKYLDPTLTGWTTTITAGDWLVFHLETTATFTAIFVQLHVET